MNDNAVKMSSDLVLIRRRRRTWIMQMFLCWPIIKVIRMVIKHKNKDIYRDTICDVLICNVFFVYYCALPLNSVKFKIMISVRQVIFRIKDAKNNLHTKSNVYAQHGLLASNFQCSLPNSRTTLQRCEQQQQQ